MDSSDEVIRRAAGRQDGVVTRAQALAAGLLRHEIDSLCRSGRWRRLHRSVYLVATEQPAATLRRAQIRAAMMAVGPHAVAVLDTAAELHRIAGLRATGDIHVSVPGRVARMARPRDPALRVHQLQLPPAAIAHVAGIPLTDPLRTVSDVILRVDRFSAVSVLDSALNRGLVTPSQLLVIPQLVGGRRGAVAARRHVRQADGRAQSPLETRVRLRCSDGGLPPDDLQHVIRDADGYILGVADLAWRQARLVAEADGAGPHRTPQALYEDRQRQNRLTNAGWRVLRFTWRDALRPDYIPFVVRQALTQ